MNAIAPGVIETPRLPYTAKHERLDHFMLRTPMARVGQPGELVGPVVFLASSMANYVTGVTLPVMAAFSPPLSHRFPRPQPRTQRVQSTKMETSDQFFFPQERHPDGLFDRRWLCRVPRISSWVITAICRHHPSAKRPGRRARHGSGDCRYQRRWRAAGQEDRAGDAMTRRLRPSPSRT